MKPDSQPDPRDSSRAVSPAAPRARRRELVLADYARVFAPLFLLSALAAWRYTVVSEPTYRVRVALGRLAAGQPNTIEREYARLVTREDAVAHALLLAAYSQHIAGENERTQASASRQPPNRLDELALRTLSNCLKQSEVEPMAPTLIRVEARLLAARLFVRLNDDRQSLELVKRALQLEPDNLVAHRIALAIYTKVGSYAYTNGVAMALSKLAPYDPAPERHLGKLYQIFIGDYDLAILSNNAALERNPWHESRAELILGQAVNYLRKGEIDESLQYFDQFDREPSSDANLMMLGRMYRAEALALAGREDDARHTFDALLRDFPVDIKIAQMSASFFIEHEDPARAVEVLEPLFQQGIGKYDLAPQLIRAHRQLGNLDRVQELSETERMALILNTQMQHHEDAAARDESDPEPRYRAGLTAIELGRFLNARTWLEAALRLKPDHAGAHKALEALMSSAARKPAQATPDPSPKPPAENEKQE